MGGPLVVRLIVAVLLAAAGIYAWRQIFPTEETRIRRQLHAMADEASSVRTDLSGLASAAKLAMYFTDDVTIDRGRGLAPLHGRQTIMALATQLRSPSAGAGGASAGSTRIEIRDADVTIAPGGTAAAVTLTAVLTRNGGSPAETVDAHEFALTMVKGDPSWQISHVTSIETLR